jgi:hypothetical protein
MENQRYIKRKNLIEWETIMIIVRKEIEPREFGGDLAGAKAILEKLPQEDGFVLKKWGDILFKEAQENTDLTAAQKALSKARSAEAAFPHARYKHEARKLEKKIKKWIDEQSTP